MHHIPSANELSVFHAVRHGQWDALANDLAESAKRALDVHKQSQSSSTWRHSYRDRELKAQGLLLPKYPMLGVFLMEHKEGSDKMLEALKKDTYVKRMDCSALVMELARSSVSSLVWGLANGWDTHFSLLQTRQSMMKWDVLQDAIEQDRDKAVVDAWIRKWVKRNPLLLQELHAPTFEECKTLLVDHQYVAPKGLAVLMQDAPFRGFFQAIEGLGQWEPNAKPKDKALLLRPYFSSEPVAQLSLPSDFQIDA